MKVCEVSVIEQPHPKTPHTTVASYNWQFDWPSWETLYDDHHLMFISWKQKWRLKDHGLR